jgi:hypothetical protein
MDKMNNFSYLYFLLVLISTSCIKPKASVSSTKALSYPPHTSSASTAERIYFINFGAKLVNNTDSCFIINTIEVDGTLNQPANEASHNPSGNNYICKVYDSNEKLIYEEEIVNPLQHRVDLYSEDGKIESKELSLKEAEFSVRFQQTDGKANSVTLTKQAGKSSLIILQSNLK